MAGLGVTTAILSVSTPGTTILPAAADAAALARDLNDYSAELVAAQPHRFGFFAALPMPHLDEAVAESVRARYPNIKFILSQAGGFVPYASHRMAVSIAGDVGASPADHLDDLSGFYFDTALSSSAAALPSLLAFAKPGHVTFGSDFPFAPVAVSALFAAGLENYGGLDDAGRVSIDRTNALRLFPRFGSAPALPAPSLMEQIQHKASRWAMRGVSGLMARP